MRAPGTIGKLHPARSEDNEIELIAPHAHARHTIWRFGAAREENL